MKFDTKTLSKNLERFKALPFEMQLQDSISHHYHFVNLCREATRIDQREFKPTLKFLKEYRAITTFLAKIDLIVRARSVAHSKLIREQRKNKKQNQT